MRQRSKYLLLTFALCIGGCVITETPGFCNGYKKLTSQEREQVVFLSEKSSISKVQNEGMIVAVNGTQLLSYARETDSLLVYTWSPHCTSKSCILISAFQDYCDSKNYEMVVVADYYDMQMMNAQNNLDLPILIANHNYYGKYFANGLNKRFIKDLLADSEKDYEPTGGRFLLLSKGKLVWQRMELKKK